MCGIAGIINQKGEDIAPVYLVEMAETLAHRGPDGEGFVFIDSQKGKAACSYDRHKIKGKGDIAFAHRRLSIIDLSGAASQPMSAKDGMAWIVYNGELFNYIEIRNELKKLGYNFTTSSDTEVVIKAYLEWGEDCLHRFNGMWAFVICDLGRKVIFGARDRFGIKPLYYHSGSGYFSFASEIKAILRLPWVSRNPFLPVIKDYLYHSRVNTSKYTFFKDIFELEPGHYFVTNIDKKSDYRMHKWWILEDTLEDPPRKDEEVYERFRELLISSIKVRLRSDVPVGTCLSGGLDSSAIACLARPYLGKQNQNSFSIVHPGFAYDESTYIDEIVKKTGIISHKDTLKGEELQNDIKRIITCQDEPFTSTSMYAQWRVFRLVRQHDIKVTLDGQGADEQLAGYSYFFPVYWAELLKRGAFKRYLKELKLASKTSKSFLYNLVASFGGFFSHRTMIRMAGKVSPQYDTSWINHDFFKDVPLPMEKCGKIFDSLLNQRLYEVFTYDGLPALLRYGDRNSMAHSVESRMPFLDHRLVSYLFSISSDWKIANGWNKHILRESLKDDVPSMILQRKDKIGFVTPEAKWFRKACKRYFQDIMVSRSFSGRGFYRTQNVKNMLSKHFQGKIDASRPIWRVANLELWFEEYVD